MVSAHRRGGASRTERVMLYCNVAFIDDGDQTVDDDPWEDIIEIITSGR
jgi:hypothetical protein